jgi:hypothetical protein
LSIATDPANVQIPVISLAGTRGVASILDRQARQRLRRQLAASNSRQAQATSFDAQALARGNRYLSSGACDHSEVSLST